MGAAPLNRDCRSGLGTCQIMTHKRYGTTTRFAASACSADRPLPAAPPSWRIHSLPQYRRARRRGRQADPRCPRQLCHPQNIPRARPAEAGCWPGYLSRYPRWDVPLSPDLGLLAQRVENFFPKMMRHLIRRGVLPSIADLQAASNGYHAEHNASPKFVWTKFADPILASLDPSV